MDERIKQYDKHSVTVKAPLLSLSKSPSEKGSGANHLSLCEMGGVAKRANRLHTFSAVLSFVSYYCFLFVR